MDALEAIGKLLANPGNYTTEHSLHQLALDVSVHAEGKVTVLYGADINVATSPGSPGVDIYTGDVAAAMASDPDIRVIDKTQFAEFANSPEFLAAVGQLFGCDGNIRDQKRKQAGDTRHEFHGWHDAKSPAAPV